ncbi:MAG TPA: isoamylase early set domain-containing protein [Syntrophales bacterium]|nr:isoamylase early set domain-containing protein [Syntrophales bacterium]
MKKTGNASARKVIFSLQWPFAREVFVAGTFNDWDPRKDQLKEGANGWKIVKYLDPGIYEYRFVVDGIWVDDPAAVSRRPNRYGCQNCVVEV